MKKVLSLLLVVIMVTSLLCTSAFADDKVKIGYDIYWLGNSWSIQLAEEFKWNASTNFADQVEAIYTESDNDVTTQISNVESFIAKGVDVIIVTPCDSAAICDVLKEARDEGIYVIVLGGIADDPDCYDSIINVDEVEFGKAGGEWLVEQLGGKGKIVCLNGIAGFATSLARFEGANSVFEQYPDIEILTAEDANWDYAAAKMAMADILAAYPEIDGVWSQGGAMTQGAIEAFQAANRELVPMTGEDNNGYLKAWKNSGMSGMAVAKPTFITRMAIETALDLCAGKEIVKENWLDVPQVTPENIDEYVHLDLSDDVWCMTEMPDEVLKEIFG